MDLPFIISAFVAGLLTFLAPCTLPLVPAYLGFISGVSPEEAQKKDVRKKIFLNGIFFVLGFSVIFIAFGALAGLVGQALVPYRIWLTRIGGVLVIGFGLFMLGVLNVPFLHQEKRMKMPSYLQVGKPTSSFTVGSTFALGWTPCVGPILGSILLLASTSTTVVQGTLLLAIFSTGLAVPFLLVAAAFGSAAAYIKKFSKILKYISVVGGVFLILLGILLLTNRFSLLVSYGFRLFGAFEYAAILEHL